MIDSDDMIIGFTVIFIVMILVALIIAIVKNGIIQRDFQACLDSGSMTFEACYNLIKMK